jgi:hypothetical protein
MDISEFFNKMGSPTGNFKQLVENVTFYSENKIIPSKDDKIYYKRLFQNWKKTSSEWDLYSSHPNTDGVCECGRTIHNLYKIHNILNNKKLIVGSHCVKQFDNKKRALISCNRLSKHKQLHLKIKFIKKCCDEHKFVYQILENHNELIKLIKKFYFFENIIEKNNKFYFRHWKIESKRKTISCIMVKGIVKFLF